ncbi:MAG: metallophosphoesterase [Planctomycetota bacterium]
MLWFIVIVLTLFLLLNGLWWWAADRLVKQAAGDKPGAGRYRRLVAGFAVVQFGFIAYLMATRFTDLPEVAFINGLVLIWHLIVLPATILVYVFAVPIGLRFAKPRPDKPDLGRRAFLGVLAATPPTIAIAAAGVGAFQVNHFRVRRLDLALPDLPAALDGTVIAHVSDTHVGTFTRGNVLTEMTDAVNALDADLVVHTGDLINHDPADIPAACEMLNAMRGRHGTYLIEGNHDLFDGRRTFRKAVDAAGTDLIANDVRRLTINGVGVDLLGLRWGGIPGPRGEGRGRSADRTDNAISDSLTQLLNDKPRRPDAFGILLAHHPHAFDFAAEADIPLTLAGHTHGGQLMLPGGIGFGPAMYRYWSGRYFKNNAAAVVSNGTGNWFPVRTFAPAEIIAVTLRTT